MLQPLIVHQLPKAPTMMGRGALSDALRDFWIDGRGVASLVGIGGAGKTTLLRQAMDDLLDLGSLDGVLVWSFYDDPDTNAFLRTAVEYFGGETSVPAQGTAWFHLLKQALDSDKRFLLILDGLERVQRPITDARGVFGELEDPLLRGLLVRLASTMGSSRAIITSRFPIADLEAWNGKGHSVLHVDQLDIESAVQLIRSHGVQGSDLVVRALAAQCGGHALTLDLLGSAIARFFGGDAEVVRLHDADGRMGELQTSRLGSVLKLFSEGLSDKELDLMSRLCVFRFGVGLPSLISLFLGGDGGVSGSLAGTTPEELDELMRGLVRMHLVHVEGPDRFTVHPAIRDHFYGLFRDVALVHEAIGTHLSTLTQRPGVGLPTTKEALDLLEELVYHALKSGSVEHALEIYAYRMGGGDHLNVALGEYARTFRILSAFERMPDSGAMYYCLRAFGRYEEALTFRPQNRYIRMLCGQLTTLRDDADENTRKIARLLQGDRAPAPERAPDHPLCPAHLHLLTEQVEEAEAAVRRELAVSIHYDDIVRNHLAMAEVHRRRKRPGDAKAELAKVAGWVMRSGSHEHLATMFLFRALQELDEGLLHEARGTLEEALQISVESEFKLLEIEARIVMSRHRLLSGQAEEALGEASRAAELAADPGTKFLWGEIRALRSKVESLEAVGSKEDRVLSLKRLMELQKKADSADWRVVEAIIKRAEVA